jgi:hypothetical protein
MSRNLLPEEDALDDPDDDEADPTLPGDLWFRHEFRVATKAGVRGRATGPVVYSRAFVPSSARNHTTWRSIRIHTSQ